MLKKFPKKSKLEVLKKKIQVLIKVVKVAFLSLYACLNTVVWQLILNKQYKQQKKPHHLIVRI